MGERTGGRTRVVLSIGFLALAIGMVGFTLVRSRDDIDRDVVPSGPLLVAAALLSAVALLLWALSWMRVADARGHGAVLVHSFLLSQLGKYIPGGVWQAAGQVGFSLRTGMGKQELGWRFVGSAIVLAAGSTVVIAAGAAWLPIAVPWRVAVGSTAVVAPIVVSFVFARLLAVVARRRVRVDQLWGDRAALPAVLLAAGGFAAYSGGYALVLGSSTSISAPAAMSAFCLAWLAGFVAVPVPAGLGVREAVLVALLGPGSSGSTVLAVSVLYRVIGVLVEVVLAGTTSLWMRRVRRKGDDGAATRLQSATESIDAPRRG